MAKTLAKPPGWMTVDQFLGWAMAQPDGARYELMAGEVVAMAPERAAHARRAQDEQTVEPGVRLGFARVDGEVAVVFDLEIATEAGIADQRLVALLQLLTELGEDGGAVGRVLLGPPGGCDRRCSGRRPRSPPWPGSRSPGRAWRWSAAATAPGRRARHSAPPGRCARAWRADTTAWALRARPRSRR